MHINHIAVWTCDLERFKRFYVGYFQAIAEPHYQNQQRGFESFCLNFHSGPRIEVMKIEGLIQKDSAYDDRRVGLNHIAISIGSEANVDLLTQRLKKDGFCVLDGPRKTGDGCYESVVLDPDGNRIELTI